MSAMFIHDAMISAAAFQNIHKGENKIVPNRQELHPGASAPFGYIDFPKVVKLFPYSTCLFEFSILQPCP